MSRWYLLLLLSLLSLGHAEGGDTGRLSLEHVLAQEGFTWTTSAEGTRNADIFEVQINGKKFALTLDTGAGISVIGQRAVKDADLATLPFQLPATVGINGAVSGATQLLMVKSFLIGNQPCVASALAVANISGVLNNNNGVRSEGVLGLPFLRANHAVIVVNPPALFLNPGHAPSAELGVWMRVHGCVGVPLDYTEAHLLAEVKLDGFPCHLLIDTGAEFSFMNVDFLQRNRIPLERTMMPMFGINGRPLIVGTATLATIEMGGVEIGPRSVTTAPKEMFPRFSDGKYLTGLFGFDNMGSVFTVIDVVNNRLYLRTFPPR